MSKEMSEFCDQHGIIHHTTALYSPQSNGLYREKIGPY